MTTEHEMERAADLIRRTPIERAGDLPGFPVDQVEPLGVHARFFVGLINAIGFTTAAGALVWIVARGSWALLLH